jgi:hypothetical protein
MFTPLFLNLLWKKEPTPDSLKLRIVNATSTMVTGTCESGGCLQIFGGGLGAGGGGEATPLKQRGNPLK